MIGIGIRILIPNWEASDTVSRWIDGGVAWWGLETSPLFVDIGPHARMDGEESFKVLSSRWSGME